MSYKDREFRICLLRKFLLLYFIQFKYCEANVVYNITSSQALSQGKTLVSLSQDFELGFFSPNNSVNQYVGIWYRGISPQTLVWVANRNNPIRVNDSLSSLRISRNGNLQLVNGLNNSIWSTNISFSSTSIAVLEDNGNFVIRDILSREKLWESFGDLGDTFLPGSFLSFNDRTGERKVLTSWKDFDDPSLGSFSFGISNQMPTQAFIWTNGSIPHWRSGPWDKSKFNGVPDMDTSYQSPLSIQEDLDKVTTNLVFVSHKSTELAKMSISPEGIMKLSLRGKEEDSKDWETLWEGPKSRCDIYGVCGPFGTCKDEKNGICECLKGFLPNSSEEWNRGIWTSGCTRRTELLLCKNDTNLASKEVESDGFQRIRSIKLPDFYQFVIVSSADECPGQCANNCSCIAYTYIDGIGCLVWFDELIDIREFSIGGEELFLRLARKELTAGTKKSTVIVISAAVVSCCILIAAAVFATRLWRTKKNVKQLKGKREQSTSDIDLITRKETSSNQNDLSETRTFDLDTILIATNNFSEENKLGQGGFGPVYKGKLVDGKELAVKRLSMGSKQGVDEFKNETNLISKLQHRNLVRLIGCCTENEEKMLIYEFMPNKSLDFFIFDQSKRGELNWVSRFNIILGVARGLLYLHRDSYLRIIHRDLKASNILLDEKMNPKISDFGLSRIFEGTSDIANTLKVVGTIGYMSPEYALAGDFSEKSDVFSFGVLILEIVSGKRNTRFNYLDNKHLSLISYAWQLWSENKGLDLVDDDALDESYSSQEATRCINIGLLCVQDHAEDRPTMPDVVFMLSNETNRPRPKRPIFTIQRPQRSQFRSQGDENKFSNKVTISVIEGR